MYPKKTGRKQAEEEYLRARKDGTAYETICEGVARYAGYVKAENIQPRYVKNLANWLRGESWRDEYRTSRTGTLDSLDEKYNSQNISPEQLETVLFEF